MTYTVKFYHRGKWNIFEEYGSSMKDVAIQKAEQLSIPFRNAEVHTLDGDNTLHEVLVFSVGVNTATMTANL